MKHFDQHLRCLLRIFSKLLERQHQQQLSKAGPAGTGYCLLYVTEDLSCTLSRGKRSVCLISLDSPVQAFITLRTMSLPAIHQVINHHHPTFTVLIYKTAGRESLRLPYFRYEHLRSSIHLLLLARVAPRPASSKQTDITDRKRLQQQVLLERHFADLSKSYAHPAYHCCL